MLAQSRRLPPPACVFKWWQVINNLQDVWDASGGECDVMLHTKIEKFSKQIDLTMFNRLVLMDCAVLVILARDYWIWLQTGSAAWCMTLIFWFKIHRRCAHSVPAHTRRGSGFDGRVSERASRSK